MKKRRIKFTVYGIAKAWKRPRFSRKIGRFFIAKQDDEWRNSVLGQALQYRPEKPFEGALGLTVCVFRPIPKSFSNKKKKLADEGIIRPITKPDWSNYVKGIEDVLEGVYYLRDAQIVVAQVAKFYSGVPRVEIEITDLEEGGEG